jgi:hypothetical protein
MKFIGQYIQSLVARFRSAVYLENIESGTIASGGNLGLDANNKIVKAAEVGSSVDLTSEISGVLPVANGGTGVNTLATDNILTGNGTGAITAEAYFTYSTSDEELIIGNPDNGDATISRRNSSGTNNTGGDLILQAGPATGNAQGGGFKFYSSTAGSSGSAVQSSNEIASINYSGNLQIDGGLTTGSTLALSNIGLIQVANQSLITGLGTITSGTWNGSTLGVEYGGTGQTSLTSNSILTGNGTSGITAESNLSYDGTNLTLTSDGVSAPDLTIESTASHSTAGNLFFNKFRADDTPPDGMMIGLIQWNSEDDANNSQLYAQIIGSAEETGAGAEGGKLQFRVATHDGEMQDGIVIEDGDAEDEIDVTIGNTATSVTTIKGTLTMGSTATLDNSGNLLTNAATATALTSGNKTISGTLDVTGNLQFSSTDGGAVSIIDSNENPVISFIDDGVSALIAAGNLDIGAYNFRAQTFTSDVATGTAPFTVTSTTAVANLQAATATTLHTARNIGGVSFNGSANIDLPGVNTAGNQNTSGNAATATNAQGITGATDADVEITSDGEVTIKLDADNDETDQKFKVVNNSGTEKFSINESGVATFTGDITVNEKITNTGTNNDLTLESDGSMTFTIDRDNDETSQSFSFKNFNVEVANLDESGNLQIDGDLTVSGGNITNAVTFDSGITNSGTIAAGTWNGTAIASAYLDADTAHLTTDQTFTGAKTFDAKVTLAGNKNITPSGDGVTLHVDAQDITDTNTSASGTATLFSHVVIENPRVLATNSSVTTTNASTVFIKGAPVASTNQTFTNSYALYVNGGNSYFGGNIIVVGNEIKDDDGTTCITFDSSGNTTIAGTTSGTFSGNVTGNVSGTAGSLTSGDKTITGTLTVTDASENIVLNSTAADGNPLLTFKQDSTRRAFIQLADDNAGFENHMRIASEYGPVSVAAASTAGSDTDTVYLMVQPTGVFKFGAADADAVLTTDGNMTFRIDADNDETGQKFSFENNASTEIGSLDESGNLNVTGIITGKQRQIYQQSFIDDLGTAKHYLPWRDTDEQTTIYQEEAAMIAPYDGRIVSVTMRMSTVAYTGTRTIQIHTFGPNASQFTTGNWTMEEEEENAISNADDNHVFYFVFDNAKHFESGELVVLSIQDDTDLHSGSRYCYVSTVVEWDYNNGLGTGSSSAEYDSAQ